MGCDIHFYVERRVDDKWLTADIWKPANKAEYHSVPYVDYDSHFYDGRNYDLFAILANVRNGNGFAGIKTGEGFNPISEPRGVPEDACQEYKGAVEDYGGDGHSHSYLTVAEILSYDWTQTTTKQGWVTPAQYARFKVNGSPESWSGGVSGGNVKHVSNEEIEQLNQKDGKYDVWGAYHAKEQPFGIGENIYTLITWKIPYYKAGRTFLSETLPRLWRLGAPENVRCLFFFDN